MLKGVYITIMYLYLLFICLQLIFEINIRYVREMENINTIKDRFSHSLVSEPILTSV